MPDLVITELLRFFPDGVPDIVSSRIGLALEEGKDEVVKLLLEAGLDSVEADAAADVVIAAAGIAAA